MGTYMQVDDTGVLIQITVMDAADTSQPYDLSAAATKFVLLGPPAGAAIEAAADFTVNSGTDGVLQYATTSGDIDEIGEWDVQAYWVNTSGDERHSTVTQFDVYENIT